VIIFFIYATFIFIVVRFAVTLFNFISDPKLRRVSRNYTDLVSILIPARNEEDNILNLLISIQRQDYQNYEVIILDDDSSDRTYELCEKFALKHPEFRVIKGKELTGGWLGKNYACYQLAQQAKGDFLLFIDADVQVFNGAINSAVHRMYFRKLALLSLFTNQRMKSFGEMTTVPLMHFILLNLLPLRLIYLSRNSTVAAASGQFMLFDAEVYRQNNWHQVTREKIVEDVEIMKGVKSAGLNGESLLANHMVSCRMYHSYTSAIDGFGKNFLAAFNYNIFAFLIFLVLLVGGPMMVFTTLNLNLITMMIALIILTRTMISLLAGQNAVRNIVLHPIQMFSMLFIAFSAIQRYLTKTTVWKGRKI
jgi:glycosyltransferase involved in cell wall biosynthesis